MLGENGRSGRVRSRRATPSELADAYLGVAARGESAIVVSQTRAEMRRNQCSASARVCAMPRVLSGADDNVASARTDRPDDGAENMMSAYYPADHVVVFNREVRGCNRVASRGKVLGISKRERRHRTGRPNPSYPARDARPRSPFAGLCRYDLCAATASAQGQRADRHSRSKARQRRNRHRRENHSRAARSR